MDLLKFIALIKYDYYKNLPTNRNNESTHPAHEEDIIYTANKLITNSML